MTGLFAGYLHSYYTYYMTGLFTGYLHPYYTYTWLIPLLVIYIGSVMYMCNMDVNNQLRDQSCICGIGMQITSKGTSHVYV
jgi:hypothetical protein